MSGTVALKWVASYNDETLSESTPQGTYIRYLEISGVREADGIVKLEELPFGEAPSRARRIVRRGDVMVSTVRTYLRAVAAAGPAEDGLIASTGFVVLRARTVDERFLRYAVLDDTFLAEVVARSTGASYPAISASDLVRVKIPFPSANEQRAIADFLDRETAQIDAFVAKSMELITLLTERRAASIDAAFEQLDARSTRLRYRASIQTGVTLGGDGDPADPVWPYLRVANVQAGRVDLGEIKTVRVPEARARRFMLSDGDVLMTEGGDRDKLGRGALWASEIEPMLHQNHVFAVKVGADLDARFLMRWLDATPSREYFEATAVQTTNLASTNKTLVGNLPLPSCSLAAQVQLVADLDLRLEKIDVAVGLVETSIRLARERRAALISAAVTGQCDLGVAV